jgi:hypothetical protein
MNGPVLLALQILGRLRVLGELEDVPDLLEKYRTNLGRRREEERSLAVSRG